MGQRVRSASDAAWEIITRTLADQSPADLAGTSRRSRFRYRAWGPFEPLDPGRLRLGLVGRLILLSTPIGRFDQTVFAEALRQALVEGFDVPRAIELAAAVNPCPIFRQALLFTRVGLVSGFPLGA